MQRLAHTGQSQLGATGLRPADGLALERALLFDPSDLLGPRLGLGPVAHHLVPRRGRRGLGSTGAGHRVLPRTVVAAPEEGVGVVHLAHAPLGLLLNGRRGAREAVGVEDLGQDPVGGGDLGRLRLRADAQDLVRRHDRLVPAEEQARGNRQRRARRSAFGMRFFAGPTSSTLSLGSSLSSATKGILLPTYPGIGVGKPPS